MEENEDAEMIGSIPDLVDSSSEDEETEEEDRKASDSPPFHGFGRDTFFPRKLQIVEPDNTDADIRVSREKDPLLLPPPLSRFPSSSTSSGSLSDSPPFHGFGKDTFFPQKLQIVEPDNVDEDLQVGRVKSKGRPKGSRKKERLLLPPPLPSRRPSSSTSWGSTSSTVEEQSKSPSSVVGPPKFKIGGTNSRAVIYLLGSPPTATMGASKIPKTGAVLRVFFNFLLSDPNITNNSNPSTLATKAAALEAARQTVPIVKEVWCHHFGIRLIFGQEYDGGPIDTDNIMVNTDRRIADKIVSLFQEWKAIEQLSRRGDRQETLQKKEEAFKEKLDIPFNILQNKGEEILCNSGIKDWKEELQHLRNQLTSGQVGSCDGYDMRQKKRDERLLREQESLDNKKANDEKERKELEKVIRIEKENLMEYNDLAENNNTKDEDYEAPKQMQKRRKVDVMGPISMTADARGISFRDRTALAASVVNAIGLNVNDTNINVHTAWVKAKQSRLQIETKVHDEFSCPDRVSLHWDGKLLKLKGNIKTNRVAVLISGADAQKLKKLMAIPETKGGSGKEEAEVVISHHIAGPLESQRTSH